MWPPHTHSDISPQHEQEHFLYNRSSCRYRNRPQTARPVLGVGLPPADVCAEPRGPTKPKQRWLHWLAAPNPSESHYDVSSDNCMRSGPFPRVPPITWISCPLITLLRTRQ